MDGTGYYSDYYKEMKLVLDLAEIRHGEEYGPGDRVTFRFDFKGAPHFGFVARIRTFDNRDIYKVYIPPGLARNSTGIFMTISAHLARWFCGMDERAYKKEYRNEVLRGLAVYLPGFLPSKLEVLL